MIYTQSTLPQVQTAAKREFTIKRKQQNQKQLKQDIAKPKANLSEKESFSLPSVILVIATVSLYILGIYQITVTSVSILQSTVEEVHQDRGLRRF